MRSITLFVPIAIGVTIASCFPEPISHPDTLQTDDPFLISGEQYYAEYCIRCHGDGSGDTLHPPLHNAPILNDPVGISHLIIQGRAGVFSPHAIMPAMPEIPDEEIAALISYLRARFGGTATTQDAALNAARKGRAP